MPFIMRDESFVCTHCGFSVPEHPSGSARNHCPKCLYSLHVDGEFPGDRASSCSGKMKPIGTTWRKNKGIMIVQKCELCGKENINILAEDDEIAPFMKRLNETNV